MLRQNINLYTPFKIVSPKLKYLSWQQLILGSVGFVSLLVLCLIFEIGDCYYQKYQNASLSDRVTQLQNLIELKKKDYPAFFFNENVEQVVIDLKKSVESETDLLEKISNNNSFSDTLIALGQIDVPNGWLNDIQLLDGANIIQLSGYDTSIEDLKLYFNNIEKNTFFNRDHLTVNKIEHTPKDNYPDFQTFTVTISKLSHEKHT